jgi:hypothetical protein
MRSNNHSAVAAFAGLLGFAVILHACADFGGVCTDELRVHLSPSDTTVAVGSTFQPVIVLSTCGGSKRLQDSFSLEADDAAVAAVDPATRRITAIGAGETYVTVTGERYGRVGAIRVAVVP